MICALPVLVGLTTLAATRMTVLGCGWLEGARKSTLVSLPVGGEHGFEERAQTWPVAEFPLATPLTVHVTARFDVPDTAATKLAR